jgi:thiamine-phosphate pyrophosphorylase
MNNEEGEHIDRRVLRVIDASYNRAREGLRVVDDAARLVLGDGALVGRLKSLRHALMRVVAPVLESNHALAHRDVAQDPGTSISQPTETSRNSLLQLVAANAARVGEALRSIEEFAKLVDPACAKQVESLRYSFYDIERDLMLALSPSQRMKHVRLYVLITQSLCALPWQEVVRQSVAGGATCFQLREKDMESGPLLARAREFVQLCKSLGAVSIINDRADIATLSDADGVHLGQSDLSIRDARRLLPPGKIVGVSTHSLEQAKHAKEQGADYIGVGPMFVSSTKRRDFIAGVETARQVVQGVTLPTFAIGGITHDNCGDVFSTGVTGVAVTAAVCGSDDPKSASIRLLKTTTASDRSDG